MNIIIHRGAHQIGGCITEISTDGAKIIIDFGSNLPGSPIEELSQERIYQICEGVDAVFYTHYHGDHVGLYHQIPHRIRQYIGAGAKEVMACKFDALTKYIDCDKELEAIERMLTYKEAEPISIQDKIIVTPYYISHSAFDAYMFKIEVEGQVILHTGDFRAHGYLGKGLSHVLQKVGSVDFLITEGTLLGRQGEKVLHECMIKQNTKLALREHKYLYALCSSTDVDRLASFCKACEESHRIFLCDRYQKNVIEIFRKHTHSSIYDFNPASILTTNHIHDHEAELRAKGFLMVFRPSQALIVEKMLSLYQDEAPYLIYSMWEGYHKGNPEQINPRIVEIRDQFGTCILDGTKDGFHTSGHADIATLEMVCRAVTPRCGIIPIHKEAAASFSDLEVAKEYPVLTESTQVGKVKVIIN